MRSASLVRGVLLCLTALLATACVDTGGYYGGGYYDGPRVYRDNYDRGYYRRDYLQVDRFQGRVRRDHRDDRPFRYRRTGGLGRSGFGVGPRTRLDHGDFRNNGGFRRGSDGFSRSSSSSRPRFHIRSSN